MPFLPNPPDLDVDELRRRYDAERVKRLRPDRSQEVLAETKEVYERDAYSSPVIREPLTDEVDVAIIGAGFAGILIGAQLRMRGVESIRIIDRAGDFGGTWYWNRYPGAQCDVESYIYLPMLEESGFMPSEKYARQPEIFEYAKALARQYDLYRDVCFQTQVTGLKWDEQQRWTIHTDRGDRIRARFVCMANGPMDKARLPSIAGVEHYEGHWFHTSRWDYAYTGGGSEGNLTGLNDKVVGIIGTGASAVQVVPQVARSAKHVYVFQRTPSTVAPRNNKPTDPSWAARLERGWQRERMANYMAILLGSNQPVDLVDDGWTHAFKKLLVEPAMAASNEEERAALAELADLRHGEELRARVDQIVADPGTRDALKPWYDYFCKRPCFHDEYLQSFNRPNVTLVDTDGLGVTAIGRRGPIVDGVEYEVDCLIFATGFEYNSPRTRRAGYEVVGREGITLSDKWADGLWTLHGMMSNGFPNLMFTPGLNSQFATLVVNFVHALWEFAIHAADIYAGCLEQECSFEVTAQAESSWVETILERSPRKSASSLQSSEFLNRCTPGYLNNEGHPDDLPPQNVFYGGAAPEFYEILARWRADGGFSGLALSPWPKVDQSLSSHSDRRDER
jgi:cyclohexanone monooxygenase